MAWRLTAAAAPRFLGKPPGLAVWWATGAVLLGLVIWQSASFSRRAALEDLQEQGAHALALYGSSLLAELDAYRVMPKLLSEQTLLTFLLQNTSDPELIRAANQTLLQFNDIVGASDTYLMDNAGLTVAASNWRSETSFVGHSFGFRPYFRDAMAGKDGLYVALGTTSHRRGFYFSHPLRVQGRVLGVAVVKVPLERLEASWSNSNTGVIVSDAEGVVFLSNRAPWRFRTLEPLGTKSEQRLRADRKYGDRPLLPLKIQRREQVAEGATLVALGNSGRSGTDPEKSRYLMLSQALTETPWTLHVLEDTRAMGAHVATTVTITTAICALLLMAALFLGQRTRYQRREHETLQRGRHLLEERVAERTTDLTASNRRLRHEIGERERAESAARKARNELIQAAKLAVLGQVAAGITHELNQPLAAIRSYSENSRIMLQRRDLQGVDENLSTVAELTEHASSIVGHLKVFARKTDDQTGPVSVHETLEHTLALLSPRFRKERVGLICVLPEQDAMVLANSVRLEQVLVNLLTNACDALRTTNGPEIRITVQPSGDKVLLLIADNGPGISEDALARIFDPFFTTKEVGSGLGLGLSISYEIVQNFRGHISAENLPEGGAQFRLELGTADLRDQPTAGAH